MRSVLAGSLVGLLVLVQGCAAWRPRAEASAACAPVHPHVYLVVVDGLAADLLDPELMPHLFAGPIAPVALRGEADAAMPSRTNPNHVTLLTGVTPEDHGVTGNDYVDRTTGVVQALDAAVDVEVPTLFTIAETSRPELVTIAAFSKEKLGDLFDEAPARQRRPDVLWVPAGGGRSTQHLGAASDRETMDAFLEIAAEREPDLAVVNLSEVDRTAHRDGPGATGEARRHADAAIARLVDDLHTRGRWERSVLIVTADHGMDDVSATPERPDPSIQLSAVFAAARVSGVRVASDGGVAHVYAVGLGPTARTAGRAATVLARAARVARGVPGVADVLARLPVPGVPTVADAHPDWRLAHERAGDLIVVAAPGYQFVEQDEAYARRLRGNHGSPRERRVPLIVAGGALDGPARTLAGRPSAADVGATVASLLGLGVPGRFDGRPVHAGTPLELPLRATRQSPHCEK